MKKSILIITSIIILAMAGCESNRVKSHRKAYTEFLLSMSDAPEFLNIISEQVNDDDISRIYFIVKYETKYCGKNIKENVKIDFLSDILYKIDGVSPFAYKTNFLIGIIKN